MDDCDADRLQLILGKTLSEDEIERLGSARYLPLEDVSHTPRGMSINVLDHLTAEPMPLTGGPRSVKGGWLIAEFLNKDEDR